MYIYIYIYIYSYARSIYIYIYIILCKKSEKGSVLVSGKKIERDIFNHVLRTYRVTVTEV